MSKLIQRPAPSWLLQCIIGRALNRYRTGQEFESRKSLIFFSGYLSATAEVAYITVMIFLRIILLHSAVHIYDFHIFHDNFP